MIESELKQFSKLARKFADEATHIVCGDGCVAESLSDEFEHMYLTTNGGAFTVRICLTMCEPSNPMAKARHRAHEQEHGWSVREVEKVTHE